MKYFARTCAFLAAAVFAGSDAAATGPAQEIAISPIIEMQGDNIIACGQRVRFEPSHVQIDLALRKEDAQPLLSIIAHQDGERLAGLALKTATISASDILGREIILPDGGVKRVAAPTSDKATVFLREYFVSGFELGLRASDGKTIKLQLDGPSPNSVRAAYLNCAGDFFR